MLTKFTTKKTAFGAAALLALLYVAGPLWAGWSLRQAMRARDIATLEARVDWTTLRANIKPRLAQAIRDSADTSGTVGGILKRAVGSAVSDAAVETMVTPANLSRLLAGREFALKRFPGMTKPAPDKAPAPSEGDPEVPDDPMPTRRLRWAFFESPTRFRVEAVQPRLPDSRVVAILGLQGFGWKLIDVDVIKK